MEIVKIKKKESYGSKVYEQLKYLIISGKIKQGEIINEQEFSEALGISRTPLREALGLMEKEGWIERDGKFRIISPLKWKDIKDLMEVREPIDEVCFRLAIEKITKENIIELKNILNTMKLPKVDDEIYYYSIMKEDTNFHRYIAHTTGNKLLINIHDELAEKIIRSSVLSMRYFNLSVLDFVEDHKLIIECLEKKELERGLEILKNHYASWQKRMMSLPLILNFDPALDDVIIDEKFFK